jgi:hypothetical protein
MIKEVACLAKSSYSSQLDCQCPYSGLSGQRYVNCVLKSRLWRHPRNVRKSKRNKSKRNKSNITRGVRKSNVNSNRNKSK